MQNIKPINRKAIYIARSLFLRRKKRSPLSFQKCLHLFPQKSFTAIAKDAQQSTQSVSNLYNSCKFAAIYGVDFKKHKWMRARAQARYQELAKQRPNHPILGRVWDIACSRLGICEIKREILIRSNGQMVGYRKDTLIINGWRCLVSRCTDMFNPPSASPYSWYSRIQINTLRLKNFDFWIVYQDVPRHHKKIYPLPTRLDVFRSGTIKRSYIPVAGSAGSRGNSQIPWKYYQTRAAWDPLKIKKL